MTLTADAVFAADLAEQAGRILLELSGTLTGKALGAAG